MSCFIVDYIIDYLHVVEISRSHVFFEQVFSYYLLLLVSLACLINLNRSLWPSIQLNKHHWMTNNAFFGCVSL